MKQKRLCTATRNSHRSQACGVARCAGTSLLEVLISLVVLTTGFVALAGLQSFALANNHSAFLRSQAVIQAHDMSDRLYANLMGVQAGNYNAISGIANNPPVCLTTAAPGSEYLDAVNCTPAQMAQFDGWEWNTMNANMLPAGAGTVAGPDGNGVYVVTVTWLEQETQGTDSKSFAFQVKPLP